MVSEISEILTSKAVSVVRTMRSFAVRGEQRVELCDALMDVEAINTLMSNNVDTAEEDPADAKYKQLDVDLVPLDKDWAEYKMVEECARTALAPTHLYYTLEILDVFKVRKEMEVGWFEAYTGIPQSANGDDSGEAKETKEKATK
ncbi:hypothetical protein BJ742DRAFT_422663 [Cladochytrium replicatum]|nr:hypothetical protein BJ742DRAFT_422663 [Cladochytrium replicatum]